MVLISFCYEKETHFFKFLNIYLIFFKYFVNNSHFKKIELNSKLFKIIFDKIK